MHYLTLLNWHQRCIDSVCEIWTDGREICWSLKQTAWWRASQLAPSPNIIFITTVLSVLLFVVKSKYLYTTNQEIYYFTTRLNTNLHPPVSNLTVFQKTAYYSGIKLFSHVPLKIKSLSNEIKLFKPALRIFLTYIHFIQWKSI